MGKQVGSEIAFAEWLRRRHPRIYQRAVAYADAPTGGRGLAGLGEEEDEGWWSKLLKGAAALGSTYLALKNQRDQLELNIERARAGQPPVDVAGNPVLTTEVQVSPEVVEKITQSAGRNVNKVLLFGGLGLLGVLLLMRS